MPNDPQTQSPQQRRLNLPLPQRFAAYVWVDKPDGTRDRKWVYGQDRDEVHKKWIKLQGQASQGPVATSTPTVAAWLDYWLKEIIEPNRAASTWENYEMFSRLYIKPGLGAKKLHRLQVRDVQSWLNDIPNICQYCAQGKDARREKKRQRCCAIVRCCMTHPSRRTIADIRNCLRSALTSAITAELITKNVAALAKLPTGRKKKRAAWSTDEARAFLESARRDNDPLYAAYVRVLILAMRKGEVLGVADDDVDFDNEELTIAYQLQRRRRQLVRKETKTEASDATLPLPAIVITAQRLRAERKKTDRLRAGDAWQGSNLVLTTQYGTPIEPRNFNRSWDARVRKAGVPKITPHDGRRTCGSLLADLDVHSRVAMAILRHAQVAVTMEIYTQASSKKTREALKKLGETFENDGES